MDLASMYYLYILIETNFSYYNQIMKVKDEIKFLALILNILELYDPLSRIRI